MKKLQETTNTNKPEHFYKFKNTIWKEILGFRKEDIFSENRMYVTRTVFTVYFNGADLER